MIIGWYIDQVDGTECPVAAVGSTPRRLCFKTLVDASTSGGHIQKRLGVLLLGVGTMFPATVPASPASTHAGEKRKLVVAFYERFFNQHDLGAADRYIGEVYIQHNPNVPNGREAVDIFRVDHGRIVEHWDVQQAVPMQAANDNTTF